MLPVPARMSKYQLLEEIGHGGMATVYRARDTRLDRDVALKLLHRHLRESEEVEARFASEARAVAKLRHPNIVEVFDVSNDDEEDRYLVVELISGFTLREVLKRQRALPPELGAEVALELAAALEHAHAQGVIHRDIKPENVLIEVPAGTPDVTSDPERARIKLTDFGIAKLLDSQGITSTGQVLGSPAHMAPEQIEGKVVDCRADVFSLGVLFYETIVGALPFSGRNPAQVLRNVLDGNFMPAEQANAQIGSRWSAIATRALQRDPAQRFQTIAEFAAALRAELARVGFTQVRRDIASYLADREGYTAGFAERIVPLLRKSAEEARAAREMPLAIQQFNRALAYRPGDPQLLRSVSRLRRRSWLLRGLVGAGVGLFGAVAVGVVLDYVSSRRQDGSGETHSVSPVSDPSGVLAAGSLAAPAQPALGTPTAEVQNAGTPASARPAQPAPSRIAGGPGTPLLRSSDGSRAQPALRVSAELPPPELRAVSVRLTGAVGGSVRIDGKERPWFGVTHQLEVGEHAFEFVPPDETCCVGSKKTVLVEPGEGPQLVVGSVAFKDAAVAVEAEAAAGWSLSCPSLFAGPLELPGRRTVVLHQVKVSGTCTVSKAEEGFTARRRVVTLRAGQTTVVPWP